MKIYKCIISGDELFTDAYAIERYNCFYRVKGKLTTRKDELDESKFGANPSQEEQEEGADTTGESGIDVVLDNRLQETFFSTKKEYFAYFKDFIKRVEAKQKEKNPDFDTEKFRADSQKGFKEVTESFKDWQFFTGASGDNDATIVLLKWSTPEGETDEVPVFYFFMDAVVEEKV